MLCKICGKEMVHSYEIKYILPEIFRKLGGYVQELQLCDDCQFICCANPVDEEFLEYLYKDGDDYKNYSSCLDEKENYIVRCRKANALFKALDLKLESVLDIGASTGFFLNMIKSDIDDICGVETSKAGIETAKNRYNIDLFKGTFHEFVELNKCKYDMITCMHVMEHVDNLSEFMRELCGVAKKYVYVEMPSLSHICKGEPLGFFAEEHLNYFTPYAIQKLMKNYGFGTIHLSVDYMPGYRVANGFPMIRAVFAKNFGENEAISPVFSAMEVMQNYMKYSIKMFTRINGIIDSISGESDVAIWGASYQLERLLAYTDVSKKNVVAIVDNSVEKQKLSFLLGDKAVGVSSPSILQTIPVDKILISTWNNWRPIYKQIESMGLTADIIPLYG